MLKMTIRAQIKKFFFLFFLPLSLQALQLHDDQGKLSPAAKNFLTLCEVPSDLEEREILPYLQMHWLQHQKERWEMDGKLEEKRKKALPFLRELGCIDTIYATQKSYTYALVLGAIGKTMQRRLDFLYEEWKRGVRFEKIVLLTGQRDLDPKLETFPEGLASETELFVHLLEHHPLYDVAPYSVIDSQKEENRRPNTASTARDFLASAPEPGSCLVISTQPFVGYQEAIIKFFLPSTFWVEAIGFGTENVYPSAQLDLENSPNVPYPMSIYLDNFAKWLLYEEMRQGK